MCAAPAKKEAKKRKSSAAAKPAPVRRAKGEQARAKLKAAAVTVLERDGYHKMRITSVTAEAGVAAGLFYHYFPDLKALTVEVLTDYMARFESVLEIEKGIRKGDWFERILAHNRVVVKNYAEHPGIMRCMVQVSDEQPEFAELWRRSFYWQLELLVELMPKLFPQAQLSPVEARAVVYALGGVGESLLRDYYIAKTPELRALDLSQDEMAEWLAVMFYRGLFLENPAPEKLHYAGKIAQLRRSLGGE